MSNGVSNRPACRFFFFSHKLSYRNFSCHSGKTKVVSHVGIDWLTVQGAPSIITWRGSFLAFLTVLKAWK